MPRKIILDTNFLMAVSQFGIDIFAELDKICNFGYWLFVVEETINELERIKESNKGKDGKAARLALALIKSKRINTISFKQTDNKTADDLIVEAADEETLVATQDRGLKERLMAKNIKLITIRQKKYLRFE